MAKSYTQIYADLVNWQNPMEMITKHFSVHEALFLPKWAQHHVPDHTERDNIVKTALRLEAVRQILGSPLTVTSWMRPEKYNRIIGGAPNSMHKYGLAVDFVPMKMPADEARTILSPHLEDLDIRMEDLRHAGWVHIDLSPDSKKRFFKP